MKSYPTHRQREVLQILMTGQWTPLLRRIAAGEKLLGNLLSWGWIERPRTQAMTTSIASLKQGGPPLERRCQ